jgi:hypothetical protein
MQYALLIYTAEQADAGATKEQQDAVMAAYFAFGEQFKDKITGGEALHPTSSATTVRLREGDTLTTDGPFAETKEQVGGFFIIEARNLNEAIEVASNTAPARLGEHLGWGLELREIERFEQP